MKILLSNTYLTFFISLLYGFAIIQLPILTSIDSENYLHYATSSEIELVLRFSKGILYGLFNEPIWLLANVLINLIFFNNPESVIFAISFFTSFTTLFYAYRYNIRYKNIMFISLLIIFPMLIANSASHLRGGFAFAIFIIGFFSNKRTIKYILLLFTPFIHISFFLILAMYFIMLFVNKISCSFSLKLFIYSIVVAILSILLFNFSSEEIRQTTSASVGKTTSSGMAFFFWLVYLFNLLINYNGKIINSSRIHNQLFIFSIITLIFYLYNYYFFYGSGRILQVTVFFHVLSLTYLKEHGKIIGSIMLILYIIYAWSTRLVQENLGF